MTGLTLYIKNVNELGILSIGGGCLDKRACIIKLATDFDDFSLDRGCRFEKYGPYPNGIGN